MFLLKLFLTLLFVGPLFLFGGAAADAEGAENFGLICLGGAAVILVIDIFKAIWTM